MCILCKKQGRLIQKDFLGLYYEDTKGKKEEIRTDRPYDIYHCDNCDTRYAEPRREVDYENVYTKTNEYDGLLEFAERIKEDPDPWWTLIGRGQQYYAALDYIKGKKDLNILEVGCGYGYLVYALAVLGHKAFGIEVSDHVVNEAKRIYGEGFYKATIDKVNNQPIDLVLALEVVEHLPDPLEFMKKASELSKTILITTPSQEYFKLRTDTKGNSMLQTWSGEMPPTHWAIYSKNSMKWLAKELNMKLRFTDYPGGPEQTIGAIFES